MTRREKEIVRTFALAQERWKGNTVKKVRLLNGDAVAYCDNGDRYLIAPIDFLLARARENGAT